MPGIDPSPFKVPCFDLKHQWRKPYRDPSNSDIIKYNVVDAEGEKVEDHSHPYFVRLDGVNGAQRDDATNPYRTLSNQHAVSLANGFATTPHFKLKDPSAVKYKDAQGNVLNTVTTFGNKTRSMSLDSRPQVSNNFGRLLEDQPHGNLSDIVYGAVKNGMKYIRADYMLKPHDPNNSEKAIIRGTTEGHLNLKAVETSDHQRIDVHSEVTDGTFRDNRYFVMMIDNDATDAYGNPLSVADAENRIIQALVSRYGYDPAKLKDHVLILSMDNNEDIPKQLEAFRDHVNTAANAGDVELVTYFNTHSANSQHAGSTKAHFDFVSEAQDCDEASQKSIHKKPPTRLCSEWFETEFVGKLKNNVKHLNIVESCWSNTIVMNEAPPTTDTPFSNMEAMG